MLMISSSLVANELMVDWERLWSPYDEHTYQQALSAICPSDVVLDIGAGDFRLAKRIADKAQLVYGIEIQIELFPKEAMRENLILVHADAQTWPFPDDITIGVLLMRHCRHFRHYAEKLKSCGAQRLITNARWGMGVELVDLCKLREPYAAIELGWYACWCGSVGFKPGPAEMITPSIDRTIHEVIDCPACQSTGE